jgi:putative addiction module component (TIGR02574 family)
MTKDAKAVLDAALSLPIKKRAEIVERLLHSLDGPPPTPSEQAAIDAAWDQEIERRVSALDEGVGELIPYEQVMTEARQLLNGRKQRKNKA